MSCCMVSTTERPRRLRLFNKPRQRRFRSVHGRSPVVPPGARRAHASLSPPGARRAARDTHRAGTASGRHGYVPLFILSPLSPCARDGGHLCR
jgi:hypothetical protein